MSLSSASNRPSGSAVAHLYRMELPDRLCPSGMKLKRYLEKSQIEFIDHPLTSRDAVDSLKQELGVTTTPQLVIDGRTVGGYEASLQHFGEAATVQKSYLPVIALFSISALLAIAVTWLVRETFIVGMTLAWFIAIAMTLLGLQKLKDIAAFAVMFRNYDLLARAWPPYARLYPFLETGAGLLMLAGLLTWISAPVALIFGSIGAFSVFKAVYLDKRDLNCACVGGNSAVPLGFVSLVENVMMVGMAVWMLAELL